MIAAPLSGPVCRAEVFDADLYDHRVSDEPGGGTVDWTNPWGGRKLNDRFGIQVRGAAPAPARMATICCA